MLSDNPQPNKSILPNSFRSSFDLRELIIKYLKRWYWFVLSMLIFGILAFLYIRYTVPLYNVSGTILISEDDSISGSELSAFQDLGLFNNNQNNIENEIQVIKSKTLISNVVNNLKLNVQYFTKGRLLEVENYPKSLIEINFLSADSIIQAKFHTFRVLINSGTSFSFVDEDGNKIGDHYFGKTINTPIGNIVITPNTEDIESSTGSIIKIQITPVKNVSESYKKKLKILNIGKGSSVLQLDLNDPVQEKAKDIINNLVDEYNKLTIENKKEVSDRTASFINERLNLISGDLIQVDDKAAGYLSKRGLTTDISADTQRLAENDSRNIQEISSAKIQLNLIESMRGFVLSNEGRYDLIPSNIGFDDINITSNVTKYNGLILQRMRLLKSSSIQNPVVVNIDEQIDGIRQVLIGSLNSLKGSINIKLKSLRTQDKYFSGKLYNAPIQQKDLKIIEREQTIKEQLYLYLLQKREEAEITGHITLSNARIIDRASTIEESIPISPNKKLIYFAVLFLGVLTPVMVIYLKDLFNVRVNSKADIDKILTMPNIGSIPKIKIKNKIVVSRTSRTGEAEAFRIVRTNLDFLMAGVHKEKGKIIFVTSTISGEGKTVVSSNLAKTLAISGKKVAYVGTDFRDPKFHKVVDLPNGVNTVGFTNYILNVDLKPENVIYKQDEQDPIDIIPSGIIPPNPAELLMHDKVKTMFQYLGDNYDYVIVDTAPVSLVTDTMLISQYADLTIFIVRENYTDKRVLEIPERLYREKRLSNMAVLLNAAGDKLSYGYGYGYGK